MLKLDGLPGGLDVDEDVQQRGDDLEAVGVLGPDSIEKFYAQVLA